MLLHRLLATCISLSFLDFVGAKPALPGFKLPTPRYPKFPPQRFPNPLIPGFATRRELNHDKRGFSRCGPDYGPCPEGLCCSLHGYCGHGPDYCQAPDCLFDYGSGCDAWKWPEGEDTWDVPRPHLGEVPYGFVPIYQCVNPNTIALTFDDGPNVYTSDLLDILDSYDAKATFFVTAFNSGKGSIDDPGYPWVDILHRMYNSGHQIASHTWSHQNLDLMTSDQRREQMIKLEMSLRNVLGAFPTYMRPPYSACSMRCLTDMDYLGYHVSYFNVDTDDYNNASPHQIQRSKDLFDHSMSMHEVTGRPMLVIAHDVHEQTVYNLTIHMLRRLYDSDYRPVTLGECLGDPPTNWYRWIDDSAAVYPGRMEPDTIRRPGELPKSNDGTCGKDYTCTGSKFGRCCSANGFCGNSPNHCGWGCQEAAGTCLVQEGRLRVMESKKKNEEERLVGVTQGDKTACCSEGYVKAKYEESNEIDEDQEEDDDADDDEGDEADESFGNEEDEEDEDDDEEDEYQEGDKDEADGIHDEDGYDSDDENEDEEDEADDDQWADEDDYIEDEDGGEE